MKKIRQKYKDYKAKKQGQQGKSSSQPLPAVASSSQQATTPARQEGEQQQGQSSMQPPPGLASSSQQATTPARPPSQSGPESKLTLDHLLSGLKAQNGSKDSLTADAENRKKSDTYAPRFMLHATSKSNADSIEETGLETSYGGKVGGASAKMNDPKYMENSKNVIHGTPSRRTAGTYGGFHSGTSSAGSDGNMGIKDNTAYYGFDTENTTSTNKDNDANAAYTVNRSIPINKVVRVPNEIIDETFDPTNPFPS